MSLAAWALTVALFGAVGTVLNMCASWANYRRVKPRLKMRVEFSIDESNNGEVLTAAIRFINRSQTAVTVERLVISQWIEGWGRYGTYDLNAIDDAETKEVPPLGGITWDCVIAGYMYDSVDINPEIELLAYLSNGKAVRSTRKIKRHLRYFTRALDRSLTANRAASKRLQELKFQREQGKQLTFDDVED